MRLEYACTPAEKNEAEDLVLVKQLGGGSRLLGYLFLLFIIAGMLLALYLKARQLGNPLYWGIGALVLYGVVVAVQKRKNKVEPKPELVEVSAAEIKITAPTGQTALPLTTFDNIQESEKLFVLHQHRTGLLIIFPKRVFPDAKACDWFRAITSKAITPRGGSSAADERLETFTADVSRSQNGITIQFTLHYRDYVDRALASWLTRGMMVFIAGLFLTAFVLASLEPVPGAVHTMTEVGFFFLLPFLVVFESIIPIVIATKFWLAHRPTLAMQTVTMTDQGIMGESSHSRDVLSWEQPTSFKETRWSFILWCPGTQVWALLPKRAFPSNDAIETCRQILTAHAKRSTWFWL